MSTSLLRGLRWLRWGTWHVSWVSIVLLALLGVALSQALPMLERHPQAVETWLTEKAQRPIRFDRVTTQWTRRGPLLRLDNLRIGDTDTPVQIGNAELLLSLYSGIWPGRSLTELRIRSLNLTLQRGSNGQWQIQGLPGEQQTEGNPLDVLERLGELQLAQAQLRVLAPDLHLDVYLPRIDVRLRASGSRLRVGARAWLSGADTPLAIAADFNRTTGDGRLYAGTRQADLRDLAGAFSLLGVSPQSGRGRLQTWVNLQAHRIVAVHVDAGLLDVHLRGAPLQGEALPAHRLGELVVDARWQGSLQQWQLHAGRLRVGDGAQRQTMDGLVLAGGQRYGLRAERLQAAPLLQLAVLSDALPVAFRQWIRRTTPDALLESVVIRGDDTGTVQADARVHAFGFQPVDNAPGMQGVSGWLQADQAGLRLRFDPHAQVAFDWPAGFGVVHRFSMEGEAVLWHDTTGWSVQSPGLALDAGQLKVKAKGGIGFQKDGTRPYLNLAADINDVPVALADGFWIHHLMPKATVEWLDTALQGGTLRDIHAVVAGDLDEWPFRHEQGMAGAGMFRADARMDGGIIKFQPDWPAAEQLDADISFVADGFTVKGRANLGQVPVPALKAGIAQFGHAVLLVDAAAAGNGRHFLSMLRSSPLHNDYGDVMDHLRVEGKTQAQFNLRLPLYDHHREATNIGGQVTLEDARLKETRWDVDFQHVRGKATFDQDGFSAEALQVRYDGQPGVLSLRSGPHVQDRKQAFEAALNMQANIDSLLDKAGNLAWLKPYMQGSSAWTVGLTVPRTQGNTTPPAHLRLHSQLQGTDIQLPAPLRKMARQSLPAVVDIRLPLENSEVEVTLGDLLSLRSRSTHDRTGLWIQLGGGRAGPPPVHGMLIQGKTERLEALDWLGVITGGRDAAAVPLLRAEIQSERLRLLGADFANSTLFLAPTSQGTSVKLQATGLEGVVLIPDQDGAAVTGQFESLHWLAPTQSAEAASVSHTQTASTFNPAAIPPLQLDVEDLRVARLALGQARFRSTPIVGGLRLDELTTTGNKQTLRATGSWVRQAGQERSQVEAHLASQDIGALLQGLGMSGQVASGKGDIHAELGWRGGPEAFDLKTVQAALSVDVHDGRLLELDPGAGRVLGLLGAAQLRRRLLLDFSDFFAKGFSFDRVHGNARLAQGVLDSDGIEVKGPAADIHVRGRTDLKARQFDQTIAVLPKSGGLLTAVGALTAGPVGAAMGAVANAVLDKPMQGIGAKTYRVTGPWSEPKVEIINRDNATSSALPPKLEHK